MCKECCCFFFNESWKFLVSAGINVCRFFFNVEVINRSLLFISINTIRMIRIRRMFICIGIPKTLTTFFCSGTKLLLPSWLLGFRHEERERHNFYYADCSIWLFQQRAVHPVDLNWTGLAQVQKSTRYILRKISTHCFLKNHQNSQSIASGHDVIYIPVSFPIWGFYYDICDCHILRARAWTPALKVCTCTCT